MTICKNCGHQFDLAYCNQCGQKASTKRIEMKWLIHDLPHAIWHVDKGILFNIKQLFTRPGYAINDFLQGKRKNFFNQLSYLAIMILLNYLVMLLVDFHTYDKKELSLLPAEKARSLEDYDVTNWWIMEHAYWYMLIAVPVIALFLFLFFNLFRKHFNLAENVIIALFIIAQFVFYQSIVYFIAGWLHNGVLSRTVEWIDMNIIFPILNGIALYQLFNPLQNKLIIGIIMLLAGEAIMQLLWKSGEWMSYLYHLVF